MTLFVLSFFLIAVGQPGLIAPLGIAASSFGYALFFKALLQLEGKKRRFLTALLWFSAVQVVQLSWMSSTEFMGKMILLLYVFLTLAVGLQFALLTLLSRKKMSLLNILSFCGVWVFFEWIRLFFLCGFSWNPIGLSLTYSSAIQFASVGGVYALSFWVLFTNMLALSAFYSRSKKRGCIWALVALFPYLFGHVHQKYWEGKIPNPPIAKVAVVQTGLMPGQKEFSLDTPEEFVLPLDQLKAVLDTLEKNKKIELIVLPEAAFPFGAHTASYTFSQIKPLFHISSLPPLTHPLAALRQGQWEVSNAYVMQAIANEFGADLIIGLDDRDLFGRYNAAFHFSPTDKMYSRYEKQLLVPVGEYIPLQNISFLSRWVGKTFGVYGSFDRGDEAKVFPTKYRAGISICIEETFSSLIRKTRLKGAKMLVNVTNDAWFPNSNLPLQHYVHGKLRSVENGVPIVRSCNVGVSAAVDSFGKEIGKVLPGGKTPKALYLDLPIRTYPTGYMIWGDFGILCVSSLFCLLNLLHQRREKSRSKLALRVVSLDKSKKKLP